MTRGMFRDPISEIGYFGRLHGDGESAFARPKDTRSANSHQEIWLLSLTVNVRSSGDAKFSFSSAASNSFVMISLWNYVRSFCQCHGQRWLVVQELLALS